MKRELDSPYIPVEGGAIFKRASEKGASGKITRVRGWAKVRRMVSGRLNTHALVNTL